MPKSSSSSNGKDNGWRTINGVHVLIGKDGTISKGPSNMVGKTPSQVSGSSSSSRRTSSGKTTSSSRKSSSGKVGERGRALQQESSYSRGNRSSSSSPRRIRPETIQAMNESRTRDAYDYAMSPPSSKGSKRERGLYVPKNGLRGYPAVYRSVRRSAQYAAQYGLPISKRRELLGSILSDYRITDEKVLREFSRYFNEQFSEYNDNN